MEVTPASEWGVKTHRVRLPSGRVVDLRKKFPSFMLMRTGALEGDMLSAFERITETGRLDDPVMALRLTDLILTSMFVDPRVGDGGIDINEIDDDDVEFVMQLAFGGAPSPGFRGEPDGAERGEGGADVRDAAVADAGDGGGDGRGDGARPRARKAPRGTGAGTGTGTGRARKPAGKR